MKILRYAVWASLFTLAPSSSPAAPLLRYSFDEVTGDALDTGDPLPSNGVLQNGAVRVFNTPSGLGAALSFPADVAPGAHVLSGDANKLDGLSALTLTTWLNVETYTSGNNRLVAKQAASTFGGFNFSMNATPNDGVVGADNFRLAMFIGNNISSGAADFGSAFSTVDVDAASKWVMLAVTYDSTLPTENTAFYIGGLNEPMTQLGTAVTLPQLTVDGGFARFGVGFTDAAPAANTSVIGLQDDVRVYGTALDAAALEAVRLQNVPEPGTLGLLAWCAVAFACTRRRG